jgi:hypothetical protein
VDWATLRGESTAQIEAASRPITIGECFLKNRPGNCLIQPPKNELPSTFLRPGGPPTATLSVSHRCVICSKTGLLPPAKQRPTLSQKRAQDFGEGVRHPGRAVREPRPTPHPAKRSQNSCRCWRLRLKTSGRLRQSSCQLPGHRWHSARRSSANALCSLAVVARWNCVQSLQTSATRLASPSACC